MLSSKISCPSQLPALRQFQFIAEFDEFLDLFPHRHSYLWAPHPAPGESPQWRTESRHPLSDRLIHQGAFLYGVRFGSFTHYLMLDIDRTSRYHPSRDELAIPRILAALEPLGLYSYVAVSSSYSGGIHLYFPFVQGQPSWELAQATQALLEHRGFHIQPGQLELFPNARTYATELTEYCGHRLPLQAGSYLLNSDWQPSYTTADEFVQRWRHAIGRNTVSAGGLNHVLCLHHRTPHRRLKGNAQKFLSDLNAEIETGWTSYGQTNHLLGRIAMREYIFHHVLYGGEPLTGDRLADQIVEVALFLPGFSEWCRHQRELIRLAHYWARAVEASNYYPYGSRWKDAAEPEEPPEPTWNQQQAIDARSRIHLAVAELLERGALPVGAKERLLCIQKSAGVSATTCYKNADLWHPKWLEPAPAEELHPLPAESDQPRSPEAAPAGRLHPVATNKLCRSAAPAPQEQGAAQTLETAAGGCGGFSTAPPAGAAGVMAVLQQILSKRRSDRCPLSGSPPPDENYFRQFPLATGGQNSDETKTR